MSNVRNPRTFNRMSWPAALLGGLSVTLLPLTVTADERDDRIESQLEKKFDRQAGMDAVDVDVEAGTATLTGTVSTPAARQQAEQMAKTAGAKRIDNRIIVSAEDRPMQNGNAQRGAAAGAAVGNANDMEERAERRAERAEDRAEKRAERREERRERQEERAEERRENADPTSLGDEVSDAWITTKIKTQFVDDDVLDGADISVDTDREGVVTLTDTVPSQMARQHAAEVARRTDGVRKVDNRLKIKK